MRVLHEPLTEVVVVRLPKSLNARLKGLAKRRRSSKSSVIRDLLETHPSTRDAGRPAALLELAGNLIGSVKGGPADLSTNKKYMEGYGR
jgi:Arc/MetJ-type ribon-helix-helix transcriptional regulator